jgi:hypothetical protein
LQQQPAGLEPFHHQQQQELLRTAVAPSRPLYQKQALQMQVHHWLQESQQQALGSTPVHLLHM